MPNIPILQYIAIFQRAICNMAFARIVASLVAYAGSKRNVEFVLSEKNHKQLSQR